MPRETKIHRRLPRLHAALRLLGMTEDEASCTLRCAAQRLPDGPEVCNHLGGTAKAIRHARENFRGEVHLEEAFAPAGYRLPKGMTWGDVARGRVLNQHGGGALPERDPDGIVRWRRQMPV